MSITTAVIWIDWYSYHLARFRALLQHETLKDSAGIELIGGCGVHSGMAFRDTERDDLPITSLFPDADWGSIGSWRTAQAVWRKLQELSPSAVLVPDITHSRQLQQRCGRSFIEGGPS